MKNIKRDWRRDGRRGRQADKQIVGQSDKQTGGWKDKQTDGRRERRNERGRADRPSYSNGLTDIANSLEKVCSIVIFAFKGSS